MSGTKRYRAFVRFGQATDTDDLTGQPVGLPAECPDASAIEEALAGFLGTIEQRPPRYSAKHVDGRRAYQLARSGKPVLLAPAWVRVDELRLVGYDGQVAEIVCSVGPGTYIRALARDLGERLGGAAHLAALRRTGVGPFPVSDAVRLGELPDRARVLERLLDPLAALQGMPRLEVADEGRALLTHGRVLPYRGANSRPEESAGGGLDGQPEVRCAVAPAQPSDGQGAREKSGLALVAVVSPSPARLAPRCGLEHGRFVPVVKGSRRDVSRRSWRGLAACGQGHAAFGERCIPAEPLHCVPLIVAFRSKYTRYSSLTRLVSRAPHSPRRSRHLAHRLLAACGQSHAAFGERCIPAEPPPHRENWHCVPLIVAFRSKYTRYASLTRLVSRAPHSPRRSRHFIHRLPAAPLEPRGQCLPPVW